LFSSISRAFTKLFERSIWADGAIPAGDRKLRSLKRLWLPIYDLGLVWMGLSAIRSGVPAFEELLPSLVADILGYLLILIAVLCLVGVSFPRLHALETASKTILVSILSLYFVSLRVLITPESNGRDTISIVVLLAIILPLFRLSILGGESRDRRDQEEFLRSLGSNEK